MIKVIWLKPHPAFAYSAGNIGEVTEKHFQILTDELKNGPYVRAITEDELKYIQEQRKPASIPPQSEFVNVTWLKVHPDFSYNVGSLAIIHNSRVQELLNGGFVEYPGGTGIEGVLKSIKYLTR